MDVGASSIADDPFELSPARVASTAREPELVADVLTMPLTGRARHSPRLMRRAAHTAPAVEANPVVNSHEVHRARPGIEVANPVSRSLVAQQYRPTSEGGCSWRWLSHQTARLKDPTNFWAIGAELPVILRRRNRAEVVHLPGAAGRGYAGCYRVVPSDRVSSSKSSSVAGCMEPPSDDERPTALVGVLLTAFVAIAFASWALIKAEDLTYVYYDFDEYTVETRSLTTNAHLVAAMSALCAVATLRRARLVIRLVLGLALIVASMRLAWLAERQQEGWFLIGGCCVASLTILFGRRRRWSRVGAEYSPLLQEGVDAA